MQRKKLTLEEYIRICQAKGIPLVFERGPRVGISKEEDRRALWRCTKQKDRVNTPVKNVARVASPARSASPAPRPASVSSAKTTYRTASSSSPSNKKYTVESLENMDYADVLAIHKRLIEQGLIQKRKGMNTKKDALIERIVKKQ